MWVDDDLKEQIQGNYMLSSQARVLAEINLNAVVQPQAIGVYQHPAGSPPINVYTDTLGTNFFIKEDLKEIPTPLIDIETPPLEQYFSLKECFTFRRPRAGIVYPLYFSQPTTTYIENHKTSARPRNYMAGKNMAFKYWTSLKMQGSKALNISSRNRSNVQNGYPIANASPAIIYRDDQPAYSNKIVIKLQTHAGAPNSQDDPIGIKWVPGQWRVQILTQQNQWITAYTFPSDYEVPVDGNIELMYGPTPPIGYEEQFNVYGKIEFEYEVNKIPAEYLHPGMAYILNDSSLWMWNGSTWIDQPLIYGWIDGTNDPFQYTVDQIINPDPNQFVQLKGVRLVVTSMSQPEIPFDLIEISPRLQLDITPYVDTYDIDKSLGLNSDLPISDLSNDVGSMTIINYDLAFSKLNKYDGTNGSIIANYMSDHTKILFYTAIKTNPVLYKYIPIKTMYVEYWPIADPGTGDMVVSIRDYFMFMESTPAPDIFLTDVSLTYTLATLLDNSGITNYAFIGFSEFNDVNIPYFFCDQQRNLIDVLSDLIHAARCGIYFDEYNNLIVASKEYLSGIDRQRDIVLNGKVTEDELTDIESITIAKRVIYNAGDVVYSPKYIQKSPINMSPEFDIGQNLKFKYDPVTLWTLGEKNTENEYMSVNRNTGAFALNSVLLTEDLKAEPPEYDPLTETVNKDVIHIGISAWYLNRFAGYLYANGEIIRYDGVEYRIVNNKGDSEYVWIKSVQQYNRYIRNVTWNGWIDITGRIRIWTQTENGVLIKHGRGYFGTPIVEHTVGGDAYWTIAGNFESMQQEHKALFNPCGAVSFADWNISKDANNRWVGTGKAGVKAKPPTFLLTTKLTNERRLNSVKSSAMNWKGPTQSETLNNSTINYFRKSFESGKNYQRFGTRMRIVGEAVSTDTTTEQQPDSSLKIFGSDAAAGGLALFTDTNRQGYFIELIAFRQDLEALTPDCPEGYAAIGNAHNLIFYKVLSLRLEDGSIVSMPFKLWGATVPLALDSGQFILEDVAQHEVINVADIEVECYKNEFDIYYNGKKYGTAVDDVNTMIIQNQKYFDETKQDQFNGDDNKNVIKSVPQFNRNSKFWGPFIRGDSRVLFENVWAAEYKTPTNEAENVTPDIFGEIELDNNYGTTQIDSIYRRHSLSGFVQKGMLQNFVNDGYKYSIFYEEFGTILRECYIVDARYTEAYPTLYARILPTIDLGNPFAISHEQLGPYGTEFVIFNVADKSIVLEGDASVIINGIVISSESTGQITVDQYMRKSRIEVDEEARPLPTGQLAMTTKILESRRRNGLKTFATIDPGPYIQSSEIAEQILEWALKYFTTEKLQCNATIFANPMIQLADLIEFRGLAGKTIADGTKMIVESISYSHNSTGPTMSVGLREVL